MDSVYVLYLSIEKNLKYRYLTYQELDVLGEDFSEYLYSMGLNKFEWVILQDQCSEEALRLLGNYSDLTFEKVMSSVKYLEQRTSKTLKFIHCDDSEMTTIGIEVPSHSTIDLLDFSSLNSFSEIDLGGYKSYNHVKEYEVSREHEIFSLIESGFSVVDEKGFNQLTYLRQTYLN